MKGHGFLPGRWPDLSEYGTYERLVKLARRRLVGCEHHAEDVVSRALMKWHTISPDKRGVARIEQVIKTEAYSVLRSEHRLRERETRFVRDPVCPSPAITQRDDHEICLLRRAMAETCKRHDITITTAEVEILELLFGGRTPSAVVRLTGLSRYEVRKARRKWQHIVNLTFLESEDPPEA